MPLHCPRVLTTGPPGQSPQPLVSLFLGSDSGHPLLRLQAPGRVPHLQSPGSLQKTLFTQCASAAHTPALALGIKPHSSAWHWRPLLPGPHPPPVPTLTLGPPATALLTRLSLLTTLSQAAWPLWRLDLCSHCAFSLPSVAVHFCLLLLLVLQAPDKSPLPQRALFSMPTPTPHRPSMFIHKESSESVGEAKSLQNQRQVLGILGKLLFMC